MVKDSATVCVAGSGPAGLFLGLLLARGGVDVVVLEKHADFLRDFRGDTVHASALTLLGEFGLAPDFAALPQRALERVRFEFDDGAVTVADLTRLPGPTCTRGRSSKGGGSALFMQIRTVTSG